MRKRGVSKITDDILTEVCRSMEQGMSLVRACQPLGVNRYTVWHVLKNKGLPTCPAKLDTSYSSEIHRVIAKTVLQSPIVLAKKDARTSLQTPEIRVKRNAILSEVRSKSKFKKKMSKSIKKMWKDPKKAARIVAGHAKPGVKEAKAAGTKAAWADPVKREARCQALRDAAARRKAAKNSSADT